MWQAAKKDKNSKYKNKRNYKLNMMWQAPTENKSSKYKNE
jgi:hypothetical protein